MTWVSGDRGGDYARGASRRSASAIGLPEVNAAVDEDADDARTLARNNHRRRCPPSFSEEPEERHARDYASSGSVACAGATADTICFHRLLRVSTDHLLLFCSSSSFKVNNSKRSWACS
jgi:hypothetical protein